MPAQKARVMLKDGAECCGPTVLDISLSDARMKIPSRIEEGTQLELIFDEYQQRFQCTVIWTNESEIGLRFDLSLS